MYFNVRTQENVNFLYIVCDMGFENKSYGLNILVVHYLQIELQLSCNYNIWVL
jgi:hypothetical protein